MVFSGWSSTRLPHAAAFQRGGAKIQAFAEQLAQEVKMLVKAQKQLVATYLLYWPCFSEIERTERIHRRTSA